MTYCKDFAPLLSAFVDGELSAAERETVLAHLDGCEACRAYLCELEAMHAAFSEMEEAEVPEGFAAAVLERARDARGAKKVSRRRRFAPLAACAALFVFVSVTTLPWINAMDKSVTEGAAPGVTADMAQMAETPKAVAEEAAPEAEEEHFYYAENSVNYLGGLEEDSAGAETTPAAEAPTGGSGASLALSEEEIAALRENAYVLHGMSADNFLIGWASKVNDGLYCIDPALLKQLPAGLSLSYEDESRLYADEAPFVYVVMAEVAQ